MTRRNRTRVVRDDADCIGTTGDSVADESTNPIDRRPHEPEIMYRAFLLYAMQHPERRSLRAVARALSRSEGLMRRWGKAWDWYDRILGPESDACAVAAYRLLFLRDHGQKEIPEVSSRMGIPISSRPAPLPESIEDVRTASAEVAKEVSRRSDGARAVRERHVKLIDAGIGYIVDQLKQGKVRTSLSDIDTLLKARSRIEGDAAPAGAAVFESVRVRAAREAGRDVIEAIEADLGELAVIVAALKTRRAANQSGDIDGYRFTVDDPDALRVVNGSKETPKSVGSTPLRVVEFDDEENDV